jgi:hypothetical protein
VERHGAVDADDLAAHEAGGGGGEIDHRYLALEVAGYTGRAVAEVMGVHSPSVYKAAQRGRADRERWQALLQIKE